jgi:hypothetical protein
MKSARLEDSAREEIEILPSKTRRISMRSALALLLLALAGCPSNGETAVGPTETAPVPSAAAPAPLPAELQGRWSASGTLPGEGPNGPMSWQLTYDLQAERYAMTGYPPIDERGRVGVLERDGARYRLRLWERASETMGGTDVERDEWVELRGGALVWGERTFTREP